MAAKNWSLIAVFLKQSEGGFVMNPHDPGGATNYGVTIGELSACRKRPCTVSDVRNLSWIEARDILKSQYWDAVHGDDLPSGLDYCVVDAAVNSGPVRAIEWLQASVGVQADGHYGVITAAAVAAVNDRQAAIKRYDAARLGFMRHLRTWRFFSRGWSARVNLVTERAEKLAA